MSIKDRRALVLASSSPRRRQILERLDLDIEVVWPQIDESQRPGESPRALALRVAIEKATAVATELERSKKTRPFVIGADTVVVVGKKPLGKPRDRAQAREMLSALSGLEHQVLTGWVVLCLDGDRKRSGVEATTVRFKELSQAEIDAYAATGEGLDKAGAYGIQGLGCFLVERIEGNYENVVGLPACPLIEALQDMGAIPVFPLPGARADDAQGTSQ